MGGRPVFRAWFDVFYDLVESELLARAFGGTVTFEHREHVTDWWCEVMGGPDTYTRRSTAGTRTCSRMHRRLGD